MEKDRSDLGRPYHHGNLRPELIDAAVQIIEAEGPAALSLREVARRLGVSHAAPAHHFPDKAALLTAIAVDGYEKLGAALAAAAGKGFLAAGEAYVRFAVDHPGHIKVMFEPSLYHVDDPALVEARRGTSRMLYGSASAVGDSDARRAGLAGWCLMHGLATLWLGGNLRDEGRDPVELARWLGAGLFSGTGS
jgi:AcrR family transcriptional regulator